MQSSSRYRLALAGMLAMFATVEATQAALIAGGDLVVTQFGDGSAALSANATAGFVKELSTTGTLVQTINMPTATSGSQKRLTVSGTATSEGFISLSGNGQYLSIVGYDAAIGTASVTSSNTNAVSRVIGRISVGDGSIDTTTAISETGTPGNPRSITSSDGNSFYVGTSAGGVKYITFGTVGASTQLSSAPTNTRVVNIYNNQLYISSASGTFQGVATVGSGLPTTTGQTTTQLNGFPTASGPSPYDYYFADASTLYLADDRSVSSGGGIQKWTLSGTTWALQYTLSTGTVGMRGLAGVTSGGTTTLYATSASSSANALVSVVDSGATSTFTTIATAQTNTAFRGVEYIPAAVTSYFAKLLDNATTTLGSVTVNGSPSAGYEPANASVGGVTSGVLGITGNLATDASSPVQVYLDLTTDSQAAALAAALNGSNGATATAGSYVFNGLGHTYDVLLSFTPNPATDSNFDFSFDFSNVNGSAISIANIAVVPEPVSTTGVLIGAAGLLLHRRRSRKA